MVLTTILRQEQWMTKALQAIDFLIICEDGKMIFDHIILDFIPLEQIENVSTVAKIMLKVWPIRTPGIVKGNNPLSLVWFK